MLRLFASLALAAALCSPALAQEVFKQTTKGTPEVGSIDVLGFAPQGVLLIGDGRGSQILAVQTGDVKSAGSLPAKIDAIDAKLSARVGTDPKGIEIIDLAVNPASGKAYIAIRKQDDKKHAIFTVDAEGKIADFTLENVTYAKINLPREEKAPVDKVTDVAWTGDSVLAAARANEEFAAKIFAIPAPVSHDAKANSYSAETYHVAHGKWETKAPMSVIIPFTEAEKKYVVGAFACTPVVKYAIDSVQPGAKVKGVSVLEIGNGNRPIDMFLYTKDGKNYVIANTFRMHHGRLPFGPSPYWTVRFERDVLNEADNINEKALRRLNKENKPATEKVSMVETFHGVTQMDKLSDKQAVVLRTEGDGVGKPLSLETVDLP